MRSLTPSLPFNANLCMKFIGIVLLLSSVIGCGTDSDIDGPITIVDGLDDTASDAENDSVDSDDTDELDTIVDPDGGDISETDGVDEDADAVSDAETVEDVDVTDVIEDADTIEDAEVIEDSETVDDSTDGDDGGGVGTPCASHCRCADNLYCDNASGTCQPIVINTGFYCCSDGPEDCPDGASCDLNLPEGGEGVCGE